VTPLGSLTLRPDRHAQVVVITPLPPAEPSIVRSVSVCLSVPSVCSRPYLVRSSPILFTCYLWAWLGPPPAAMRYVMYFRFYGDVMGHMDWRHVDIVAVSDVIASSRAG